MCGVVRHSPAFLTQLRTLTIVPPVAAACLLIALF
jgi:hypothetical protein